MSHISIDSNLSLDLDNSIEDISYNSLSKIKGGAFFPPPTGVAVIDDPVTGELVFVPFPIRQPSPFPNDRTTN